MMEKAILTDIQNKRSYAVLFNPEEYTLNKDNNFAQSAVPGLRGPILQFVNGSMRTLEMELLVDSLEEHREGNQSWDSTPGCDLSTVPETEGAPPEGTQSGVEARSDVREVTRNIVGLMDIDPEIHAPPVLLFTWGTLCFKCVLARASERYVMFLEDGTPVRARLNVTFNEYIDPDEPDDRQTVDYSKAHIVLQGESLAGIAQRFYQDPQAWRPIAIANGIDDPRQISIGQQLRIPSLPFADVEPGEVIR